MTLPPPVPGSVIRYCYLWAGEHGRGREEAGKERPVLVLALSVVEESGRTTVLVVAITHSPPAKESDAVPLPGAVKRRLGLDDSASWIVTTEANAFVWPGPDIRPLPAQAGSARRAHRIAYGAIPDALLRRVAQSYLANRKRQQGAMVHRGS